MLMLSHPYVDNKDNDTKNNDNDNKYEGTYGVKSSNRKGEPSVTRVYTKVPSMKTPKMPKRTLRVTTKECCLFGSVPVLCEKTSQSQSEQRIKFKRLYKIIQQPRP